VVPDKGHLFGPENVLPYTIPDFEKKLFPAGDKKNFIFLKFDLLSSCLQGIAVTKWDMCATKYPSNKRMEKHFNTSMKDYLETTAKCTNLGDQVIRWLHLKAKPAHTKFRDFLNCPTQIFGYIQKGWSHHVREFPMILCSVNRFFWLNPKPTIANMPRNKRSWR
jgi:hypothetical protein